MNPVMRYIQTFFVACMLLASCAFAQKVKVGYDKSTDFSKYKTYTLLLPKTPSSRILLYESVVGTIKQGLQARGLTLQAKDGDLTVVPRGGVDYGLPSYNPLADTCDNCQRPIQDPLQWSGTPPMGPSGKSQPIGTLELEMVDRAANKIVWDGTVVQKLEQANVDKSLVLVGKAINKLIAEYPPKKEK